MQALWCDHDPSDVTITNYVKSENRDLDLLIDYVDRLDNGGVFKRMGFLLERLVPEEQEVIDACRRVGQRRSLLIDWPEIMEFA